MLTASAHLAGDTLEVESNRVCRCTCFTWTGITSQHLPRELLCPTLTEAVLESIAVRILYSSEVAKVSRYSMERHFPLFRREGSTHRSRPRVWKYLSEPTTGRKPGPVHEPPGVDYLKIDGIKPLVNLSASLEEYLHDGNFLVVTTVGDADRGR